ncbi:ATP-binding cassette sub-family A member 3-like Protein [Tribolium castaneum]|uniref:kynurenine--glyoxylate transaminase n=1 Tax=Tribolium castaneum TaxID=7070 RepID=A0A139WL25_TRICA|nr:ATP-binding cassette sub-family A member 3-like Protein [Tribolium castaneum]
MSESIHKIRLLLWKNGTLVKRSYEAVLLEWLYPVIICLFVIFLLRPRYEVSDVNQTIYEGFTPKPGSLCFISSNKTISIAYSPTSPLLEDILKKVCLDETKPKISIKSFKNSNELNAAIKKDKFSFALQSDDFLFGLTDRRKLPDNLNINLRLPSENYTTNDIQPWFTNLRYPLDLTSGPRNYWEDVAEEPGYESRGFLYLQTFITLALTNNSQSPKILINRFSYPKWSEDKFYSKKSETLTGFLLVCAFTYTVNNLAKDITTEKEKQLKESMKVMGLPGWLHWLAWFLRGLLLTLVTVILMTVLLKIAFTSRPVFVSSDGTIIFVFLLLFGCSCITFTFLLSTLFSKATTAVIVCTILYIVAVVPAFLLQTHNDVPPQGAKMGACLLAPSAMFFGISVLFKFEGIGEGSQWDNLFKSTSPSDKLTLGIIFVFLIVDTLLYMVLALYLEAVFPGDFGVPQPWYFPFTRAYWCSKPPVLRTEQPTEMKGNFFEEFSEKLPVGIKLVNLSKSFGSHTAVKNLNLDMYEGHITVLLGHNGAGKTTTMSMICGMFPPSGGTAIINGYDIRTNIRNVRESMGICPQHNVLFDNLTVREHLHFFGELKGLKKNEINEEIDDYIKVLDLEDKKNTYSKNLSGGMKRKLSVGIALCGKSKVVMLDEPTAGMDPSARRKVWNLLQKQKTGRTILLTTHYMDEADLLGDRIAIMTAGELQCCGSSFFLKKTYASGYYLILDVTPKCRPSDITNLLREYIPYLQVHSHIGSELTYKLPEESHKFEALLGTLESRAGSLEIQNFGISLATLEEIFLKVGADNDGKTLRQNENNKKESTKDTSRYEGFSLLLNQIMAMILKKVLATFRSWMLFLMQVIIPILIALTIIGTTGVTTSFPPNAMSLNSYTEPIILIENNDWRAKMYAKVLGTYQVKTVKSLTEEILTLTSDSPITVRGHYIVGASFNKTAATAWFNGDPYHAVSLSLGLVLNTIYKETFGKKKSINFINYPLPLSTDAQLKASQNNNMRFGMQLGLAGTIVVCIFILFYVRERITKCKHLQMISGVNPFVFWSTSLFFDIILFFVIIIFCLVTITAGGGLKESTDKIGVLILIFACFCFFVFPFIYLFSLLFKIPATAFSIIFTMGIMTGMMALLIIQIIRLQYQSSNTAQIIHWIFFPSPFYIVGSGISEAETNSLIRGACVKDNVTVEQSCNLNKICCDIDYFSSEEHGVKIHVIVSLIMSIVLLIVIFIIEYGFFDLSCATNTSPPSHVTLESDVQAENQKIKNTPEDVLRRDFAVVLRDVTKYYKKFLAVNHLCLGVKPNECFGLLGVNGAGKTTTFKMMTGDERISSGDAWIQGFNVKTQQKQAQKYIGYCPQFDALLDDFTAKETLVIFGLIRGVPFGECISLAERLAEEFDFSQHLNKTVKTLSGGNKRKLSTAIALIGDPPVIFLDEPSAGMDPATKRFLWNGLAKLRDAGKCLVLTSHSMEECEALCTRIAIMVNGTFQCLGSSQRLKSKFAQGYLLTIKIIKHGDKAFVEDQIAAIDGFVQKHFPGSELKERYQELVSYHLVNPRNLPLSKMFGIIEAVKRQLNIEDYSLGQCSLEQVFLINMADSIPQIEDLIDLRTVLPDFSPPEHITETLALVSQSSNLYHQYTRDYGHPRLVTALAGLYSQFVGRQIDPMTEILTTVGAHEALFVAIHGHVDVGDEVVIFEPFLPCYKNLVESVGGIAKFVTLNLVQGPKNLGNKCIFDSKKLENCFNEKTKIVILNNPNEYFGKVFTLEELEFVAFLCQKWNVLCISDETNEFSVSAQNGPKIASLPNMWSRTLTIGSAERTFGVTGWKVGWVYGPSNLLFNLLMVHQNSLYTGNTPLQETVARCIEKNFQTQKHIIQTKKQYFAKKLTEIGLKPIIPEGGYYIILDLENLVCRNKTTKDSKFCEQLGKMGLLGTPMNPFFSEKNKVENYVAFSFFKKNETLDRAINILKQLV